PQQSPPGLMLLANSAPGRWGPRAVDGRAGALPPTGVDLARACRSPVPDGDRAPALPAAPRCFSGSKPDSPSASGLGAGGERTANIFPPAGRALHGGVQFPGPSRDVDGGSSGLACFPQLERNL